MADIWQGTGREKMFVVSICLRCCGLSRWSWSGRFLETLTSWIRVSGVTWHIRRKVSGISMASGPQLRAGSERHISVSRGGGGCPEGLGSSCQVSKRERKEPQRRFCLILMSSRGGHSVSGGNSHLRPLTPCRGQASAAVVFIPALSSERRTLQNM